MRSELSEKNKYYVNKYRYLELKYRCLQYPDWNKAYETIHHMVANDLIFVRKGNTRSDPVAKYILARDAYYQRMKPIEDAAVEADEELSRYILKGVTEGLSYDVMNANEQIPCSRDTYYDRYRRFFFILDKMIDKVPNENTHSE